MKELIEALNLPKQILDKTEKLLSTLFGEGAKEIGGIFGDKMRLKRLKNQINILNQANEIIEKSNLQAHQINLKALVPLLEKSSLEEDENIQKKWANLIANISTTQENGLEPRLINSLSNISSVEATILDHLFTEYILKRDKLFDTQNSRFERYKQKEDVSPDQIYFSFQNLRKHFDLKYDIAKIYIDNFEAMKIIRYDDPEIEIDEGFPEAEIVENRNGEQEIELNLDFSTKYKGTDDFYFTAYGVYFMSQCKEK